MGIYHPPLSHHYKHWLLSIIATSTLQIILLTLWEYIKRVWIATFHVYNTVNGEYLGHVVVVSWARVICLICNTQAQGLQAQGVDVHIRG